MNNIQGCNVSHVTEVGDDRTFLDALVLHTDKYNLNGDYGLNYGLLYHNELVINIYGLNNYVLIYLLNHLYVYIHNFCPLFLYLYKHIGLVVR